jgi:hypothetical protein
VSFLAGFIPVTLDVLASTGSTAITTAPWR